MLLTSIMQWWTTLLTQLNNKSVMYKSLALAGSSQTQHINSFFCC